MASASGAWQTSRAKPPVPLTRRTTMDSRSDVYDFAFVWHGMVILASSFILYNSSTMMRNMFDMDMEDPGFLKTVCIVRGTDDKDRRRVKTLNASAVFQDTFNAGQFRKAIDFLHDIHDETVPNADELRAIIRPLDALGCFEIDAVWNKFQYRMDYAGVALTIFNEFTPKMIDRMMQSGKFEDMFVVDIGHPLSRVLVSSRAS